MNAARRWFRTAARVGLGLFIVGQLLFFAVANFVPMLQQARPHLAEYESVRHAAPEWAEGRGTLQETSETLTSWAARWSEATGQPERWSLFAPEVGHSITFVAVELRWDDAATYAFRGPWRPPLYSENEPEDLHHFFRIGKFRFRRYEGGLDLLLTTPADKKPEEMKDAWRGWIGDKVQGSWKRMRAYLQFRTREFLARHPDAPPPRQAILYVRRYEVPEPGAEPWFWRGPFTSPVARWRPNGPVEDGYLPVEAYNPLLEQFEPVRQ